MPANGLLKRFALVVAVLASPAAAQVPAPCGCDINNSGSLSVQDIFDMLAAYFGGDPRADINGNGVISVQDIFDSLACYFAGCPEYAGQPNSHDMGMAPIGMPGCGLYLTGMSAQTTALAHGVHLFSGETFRHEVDMQIPGRGFDFVMARTYRSQYGPIHGEMGSRWDYSYNIFIYQRGADLVLHDGSLAREDLYTQQGDGSWTGTEFFRRITATPGGGYTVELANGTRWITAPAPFTIDGQAMWKLGQIVDRNNNTMSFAYSVGGRLVQATDTLGNIIVVVWWDNQGFLIRNVTDHTGRMVQYAYYDGAEAGGSAHDLKSVTTPAVTGTPNGNDFPSGKTTVYTYTAGGARHELNHRLLTATDGRGQTFLRNEYNPTTDISDAQFGRVSRQTWGSSGDLIDFVYVPQTPGAGNNFSSLKTIVNDRVGNVRECFYDATNRGVMLRELTGRADPDLPTTESTNRPGAPLRTGDPAQYETRWTYTASGQVARIDYPNGNSTINTYDSPNANLLARGNLLQRQRTPGPLGGDQPSITESWQYLTGFGGCGCGGAQFVTQHTDPRGNVTTHTYDLRGNRTRTEHRIASIVEDWEYNAFGQMTAHILPDNGSGHRRRDEYAYYTSGPQNGRLQSRTVDAGVGGLALTTGYEYNARGHVVRVTDADGDDTLFTRNQLDQVVRRSSPTVSTPSGPRRYDSDYAYDAANNLVSVSQPNIDADGVTQSNAQFTTSHDYDVLNRLVRTTREVSDTDSTVEEYTYDANGNLTLTRAGEAVNGADARNTVARSYDERNRVLDVTQAPGAPVTLRNVTRYHYDGNGNTERIRRGINGTQRLTLYTHDGYDRRITTVDPMGNVNSWHYDAGGNITIERADGELVDTPGSGANVRLSETSYTYDAMDRRTRRDAAFFNAATQAPLGDGLRTTQWTYSGTSALLTETDDNGRTNARTYDRANRLSVYTDAAGNTRSYQWNADGTVAGTACVDVPDLGGPTQAHSETFAYDQLDRMISRTDSAGSVTQYRYDSRGNLSVQINGRGDRREWAYDGLNRLTRIGIDMNNDGDTADTGDIVTTRQWDDDSRLIAQTDDNGNTTRHSYDSLNRRIITQFADGTIHQIGQGAAWPLGNPSPTVTGFTNGHDIHGNIITTRDANGTVVTHQYDVDNRLTRRDVAAGAGVSSQTTFETYTYDGRGRVLSATDDDSNVTFTYDSLSNVMLENQNGLAVARTFDAEGNELSLLYPSGRLLTKMFDELNRPDGIYDIDPGCPLANFHYVGPDRMQAMDFACTTRQTFTYDGLTGVPNPAGDLGSLRVVNSVVALIGGGPAVETMAWTHDRAGNTTSRTINGTATDDDYQYDSANRLIRTDRAASPGLTTYALDGFGNRTSVGGALDSGAYAMNATLPSPGDAQANQYTSTPFDSRGYDSNGNLISITPTMPAGPGRTLVYDYRNRLVQFTDPSSSTTATYKHDALGRRIEKSVASGGPATVTRFVFDGQTAIESRDGGNALIATWVWGDPLKRGEPTLLNSRAGASGWFYFTDAEHRAVLATDMTGATVERYRYYDFDQCVVLGSANQTLPASVIGNPFRRSTWHHDPESGLHTSAGYAWDSRAGVLVGSLRRPVSDPPTHRASTANPVEQPTARFDEGDHTHRAVVPGPDTSACHAECDRIFVAQFALETKAYIASAILCSAATGPGAVICWAGVAAAAAMAIDQLRDSLNACYARCDGNNSYCAKDSDCGAGNYCDKGTLGIGMNECKPKKSNGQTCSRGGQCQSGCCRFVLWQMHSECKPSSECN